MPSRPTEATTSSNRLHAPFTTKDKAEMAEGAKPAPQQLNQISSSAATTSPGADWSRHAQGEQVPAEDTLMTELFYIYISYQREAAQLVFCSSMKFRRSHNAELTEDLPKEE